MKFRPFLAVLIVIAVCLFEAAYAETLTILHTNDLHSRIEPINRFNKDCTASEELEGQCYGGYARLAAAINDIREQSQNLLLLDAGDQFQGTLFFFLHREKIIAEMMNTVGYDAMAAGNFEFVYGPAGLRKLIDAVQFPILLANADVSVEPKLSGAIFPSTIIERAGNQYGLIGVISEQTAEISSPGPNIRFFDPIEAIRSEVRKLTDQGVDRIIVLSHVGYHEDLRIAAMVDGIDVIVGGHSNTLLSNVSNTSDGNYPTLVKGPKGGLTAIVHAYAYGKYLGRLDIDFDDSGRIVFATGEPILLDDSAPEDKVLKARIAELAVPVAELHNQVIAEAAVFMDGSARKCRRQQCEVGSIVADAMLQYMRPYGIEIGIMNGGGVRASISKGPITRGDILTVLPFHSAISRFKLSGADIVASLENGVSAIHQSQQHGRFPQVAGIRFEYTLLKPPGQRITKVDVFHNGEWTAIEPDKNYGVVTNEFLRNGGDGYSLFADNAIDAYDNVAILSEVVIKHLAANSPYIPNDDKRIFLK